LVIWATSKQLLYSDSPSKALLCTEGLLGSFSLPIKPGTSPGRRLTALATAVYCACGLKPALIAAVLSAIGVAVAGRDAGADAGLDDPHPVAMAAAAATVAPSIMRGKDIELLTAS
jgi:hypothetical protein